MRRVRDLRLDIKHWRNFILSIHKYQNILSSKYPNGDY